MAESAFFVWLCNTNSKGFFKDSDECFVDDNLNIFLKKPGVAQSNLHNKLNVSTFKKKKLSTNFINFKAFSFNFH